MAKKPRNPIDADEDDQLKLEFIPEAKLKTLLRAVKSATKAKDEAVATLRGHIAQAVEKNFLDKRAFAIYRKFESMEDDELHKTWSHLIHMLTISGQLKRAQTAPKEEKAETPAPAREDGNIAYLGRGRRRVVEEVA